MLELHFFLVIVVIYTSLLPFLEINRHCVDEISCAVKTSNELFLVIVVNVCILCNKKVKKTHLCSLTLSHGI